PMIVPGGQIFMRDRVAIAQALLERRSPSIAAFRENMEAGALISYGFDLMGLFYDIASYVHRIAGGANPSDMPIEQLPRFYMAVNLKTAASLGVSLSDVFIARANEVREWATGLLGEADWGCHAALSRSIALRVVIIFRMTATMMTLDFLSASARRLWKALRAGLYRLALRAAM